MKDNKKFLALCLAAVMAASTSTVVFAEETGENLNPGNGTSQSQGDGENTEEKDESDNPNKITSPDNNQSQNNSGEDPVSAQNNSTQLQGDGTQQNPYQITDADDLALISTDNYIEGRYIYVELMNDIDLSGTAPKFNNGYVNYFQGEFNGNNHIISGAPTGSCVFKNFLEGTVKNLTWNIEDTYAYLAESNGTTSRITLRGCTFDTVNVTGNVIFPNSNNNNESPLVIYSSGITTFRNVNISANITSAAAYNGIFVGYTAAWEDEQGYVPTTFNFESCTYSGKAVGDQLGMFFGNPTRMEEALKAGALKINVNDCTLSGTITANRADFLVADIGGNQYKEGSELKKLNDEIQQANARLYRAHLQKAQKITDYTVQRNSNGELQIKKNSDSQGIAEIRIAASVYSNMYNANGENMGTYLHTKVESIPVTELKANAQVYPTLNYGIEFYDGEGELGTTGPNQSIETVTVDGKTYLKLCDEACKKDGADGYFHRFAPAGSSSHKPSMIQIIAYDASGKQIGIIGTISSGEFTVPQEPEIPEQENPGIEVSGEEGNQSIIISEDTTINTIDEIKLPEGCSWMNPKAPIQDGGQTFYVRDKDGNIFPIYVEKKIKQGGGNTGNGGGSSIPGTGAPITTGGRWVQSPAGWWYRNADGTWPANQWKYLDGGNGRSAWYWFNQNGYITFGWQYINGNWYYMNRSGEMQTGWQFINNKWYYLNQSGVMATGWVQDGGKWYYMNDDGSMHFGWLSWAGYWYHLDSHGVMSTGWKYLGGEWYYLYPANGRMAANTTTPDGYRVDASGAWIR